MNQAALKEQAAVQVYTMGISAMEKQGEALAQLMNSTQMVSDPNLGQIVDLSA